MLLLLLTHVSTWSCSLSLSLHGSRRRREINLPLFYCSTHKVFYFSVRNLILRPIWSGQERNEKSHWIISCDTAWTFNRGGGWCGILPFRCFFIFFFCFMSMRKPCQTEILPSTKYSDIWRRSFFLLRRRCIPLGWRLTTKKERRKQQ